MRSLTKKQAREFKRRWEAVNRAEIKELRRSTPEEKLRQLFTMMEAARVFGWDKRVEAEEAEVRRQWKRLRRAYGVS